MLGNMIEEGSRSSSNVSTSRKEEAWFDRREVVECRMDVGG